MGNIESKKKRTVRILREESIQRKKGITILKAYMIALEHLGSHDEAVDLLLTDECGYQPYEINAALSKSRKYSKALNPESAF